MELLEAIKTRRSVRKYKNEPVPRAVVEELLNDALWAPSNANKQEWHLVVVGGETRHKLGEIVKEANTYMKLKLEEDFPTKPHIVSGTLRYFEDLGGAPLVILIYVPWREQPGPGASDYEIEAWHFERKTNIEAASAVAYNITLLAHSRGLATCWMTGPTFVDDKINEFMGIEDKELVCLLPLGYPDQEPKAPPRKGDPIEWVDFE